MSNMSKKEEKKQKRCMKLKILRRCLPLVASTFLGRCNVLVAAQARCGVARMSGTGLTDNLQLGSREAEPGQTQLRIEAGMHVKDCMTFTGQIYAYIRTHSLSLSRSLSLSLSGTHTHTHTQHHEHICDSFLNIQ